MDLAYYVTKKRVFAEPGTWNWWHEKRHEQQDERGYFLLHDGAYPVVGGVVLGLWLMGLHWWAPVPFLLHFAAYAYFELDASLYAFEKTRVKQVDGK